MKGGLSNYDFIHDIISDLHILDDCVHRNFKRWRDILHRDIWGSDCMRVYNCINYEMASQKEKVRALQRLLFFTKFTPCIMKKNQNF